MPAAQPASATGTIGGTLGYPSDFIPPMVVYAIPVNDIRASVVRASATCYGTVETVTNQQTFHILGLAPGSYYVLATWLPAVAAASDPRLASAGRTFGGAYTNAVACGLQYTCTDHSLIPVAVQAGRVTSGVAVTDWYSEGTFPSIPTNAVQPARLGPQPAAYASARDAAIYSVQVATGAKYVQSACPANHACVSLGDQYPGTDSTYFLGTAGSNTDLRGCAAYVSMFDTGWHWDDVVCKSHSPVFPSVGVDGVVAGYIGDTGCVNIRRTAGRAGAIVGCLNFGSKVTIDGGPTLLPESDSSLELTDRLWWHLQGLGWMVHRYLRNG